VIGSDRFDQLSNLKHFLGCLILLVAARLLAWFPTFVCFCCLLKLPCLLIVAQNPRLCNVLAFQRLTPVLYFVLTAFLRKVNPGNLQVFPFILLSSSRNQSLFPKQAPQYFIFFNVDFSYCYSLADFMTQFPPRRSPSSHRLLCFAFEAAVWTIQSCQMSVFGRSCLSKFLCSTVSEH